MEALLEPPQIDRRSHTAVCAVPSKTVDFSDVLMWNGIWVLVYCEPSKIWTCQRTIEGFEVPVYVPIIKLRKRRGDEWRNCSEPLFAGYLFACIPTASHHPGTSREWACSRVIPISDQKEFRLEIGTLQKALDINPFCKLRSRLTTGTRVLVTAGPYRGIEGIFERAKNDGYRLVINVRAMGQSVPFEIDPECVEVLDDQSN